MSSYIRSTRECAFEQLRPELRRAILEFAQSGEIGSLADELLGCCETKSEKKTVPCAFPFGKGASVLPEQQSHLVRIVRLAWVGQNGDH